jgi:hypothetical protein
MLLSNLGCRLFYWLGLIDSCEQLQIQEENMDSVMLLKLLFVPMLGVMLISLFLLEDYCYSYSQWKVKPPEDPASIEIKKIKNWNVTEPTRLSLVDETGASSCFKIVPSIPMREVLQFYCQKNNAILDDIILRYEGKKLLLSETPEKLGLTDLAVIDVEADYRKRFDELRKSAAVERARLQQMLEDENNQLREAQHQQLQLFEHCKLLSQQRKELEHQSSAVDAENAVLRAAIAKLDRDLKSHQLARKEAELERDRVEKEYTGAERTEREWMDNELKQAQRELEKLPSTERDANAQQKEKKDLQDRLTVLAKQAQNSQKDILASQQRKQRLTQQLQPLEQYKADILKQRALVANLDRELVEVNKDVGRWKQKHAADELMQREAAKLRKQLAAEPKPAQELDRLQNLARQREDELAEAQRWGPLAAQVLSREKLLENEVADMHCWRQRAVSLEKELSELHKWKTGFLNLPQPLLTPQSTPLANVARASASHNERSLPSAPARGHGAIAVNALNLGVGSSLSNNSVTSALPSASPPLTAADWRGTELLPSSNAGGAPLQSNFSGNSLLPSSSTAERGGERDFPSQTPQNPLTQNTFKSLSNTPGLNSLNSSNIMGNTFSGFPPRRASWVGSAAPGPGPGPGSAGSLFQPSSNQISQLGAGLAQSSPPQV